MKVLSQDKVKELVSRGDLEPEDDFMERQLEAVEGIEKHLRRMASESRGGRLEEAIYDLTKAVMRLEKEPKVVEVRAPAPKSWSMDVERDAEGRMEVVHAKAEGLEIAWRFTVDRNADGKVDKIRAEEM